MEESVDQHLTCPVCEGAGLSAAFVANGQQYQRCESCGFAFHAEAKTAAAAIGYEEERTHAEGAYQEHEQNLLHFDAYLERIERHVKPGRFLDVGCSIGTSLVQAERRGWDAVGIELCRPAAEWARKELGVRILTDPLQSCSFEPGSFRAIWMHHTLEHLDAPDRVLADCLRLLEAGGVLFQALPNHESLKSRLFGEHWSYGVTMQHVSLFGRSHLLRLCERLGFEVLEHWTRSHRADPRFLRDLMASLDRMPQLGRYCGRPDGSFDQEGYIRLLTDHFVPRLISQRLWPKKLVEAIGLGEEVCLIARRPHEA